VAPRDLGTVPVAPRTLEELARVHRAAIAMQLEKTLKSERVLRDLHRQA
jgi:hypothetical protein